MAKKQDDEFLGCLILIIIGLLIFFAKDIYNLIIYYKFEILSFIVILFAIIYFNVKRKKKKYQKQLEKDRVDRVYSIFWSKFSDLESMVHISRLFKDLEVNFYMIPSKNAIIINKKNKEILFVRKGFNWFKESYVKNMAIFASQKDISNIYIYTPNRLSKKEKEYFDKYNVRVRNYYYFCGLAKKYNSLIDTE
jgi:hypothetical protein